MKQIIYDEIDVKDLKIGDDVLFLGGRVYPCCEGIISDILRLPIAEIPVTFTSIFAIEPDTEYPLCVYRDGSKGIDYWTKPSRCIKLLNRKDID